MSGTPGNIVVGAPSSVKIGAYNAVEGDCVDVGFTDGGVKLTPALEYYQQYADQALGPLAVFVTKRSFVVEFDFIEATLANLQKAMGLASTALVAGVLSVGDQRTITSYTIFINGPGVSIATRKFKLQKAVFIGDPEYVMKKNANTAFRVKLLLLEDTSKGAGTEFYALAESGADTTPPTIALTTPVEDGTVTKNTKGTVTLTFTEADNAIDEGTLIDGVTIMIMNVTAQAENVKVAGTWVFSSAAKTLIFTPTSNWTASDKLCVIITMAVKDTAGNALAAVYVGNFTVSA